VSDTICPTLVISKDTLEGKAPIQIELPTDDRIEVAVLGEKGNQMRIGTDAPDEITIVRQELLEGLQSKT